MDEKILDKMRLEYSGFSGKTLEKNHLFDKMNNNIITGSEIMRVMFLNEMIDYDEYLRYLEIENTAA